MAAGVHAGGNGHMRAPGNYRGIIFAQVYLSDNETGYQ